MCTTGPHLGPTKAQSRQPQHPAPEEDEDPSGGAVWPLQRILKINFN